MPLDCVELVCGALTINSARTSQRTSGPFSWIVLLPSDAVEMRLESNKPGLLFPWVEPRACFEVVLLWP